MLSQRSGIITTSEDIYAFSTIDTTGWKLCAKVPKSMITNSIRSTTESISIAILVFIIAAILIVLIVLILSRRTLKGITAPIELLGSDMKRISDGDLDHRAAIVGNDEISDTASRLNEMVERLIRTKNALSASRFQAEEMAALANKDALTGKGTRQPMTRRSRSLKNPLRKEILNSGSLWLT